MLYAAVIGDIVGSRKLPNRGEVQQKFLEVARAVNLRFREAIESPFTITLGDEFQILVHNPVVVPDLIPYVKKEMHPVQLVFGVGLGVITTEINRQQAIGMDGPAFHFARQALEKAKKKKPGVVFLADHPAIEMVNALQHFIESCLRRRTRRQLEAVDLFELGLTQQQIAQKIGVTQETVSELISSAYYWEVQEALSAVRNFLATL